MNQIPAGFEISSEWYQFDKNLYGKDAVKYRTIKQKKLQSTDGDITIVISLIEYTDKFFGYEPEHHYFINIKEYKNGTTYYYSSKGGLRGSVGIGQRKNKELYLTKFNNIIEYYQEILRDRHVSIFDKSANKENLPLNIFSLGGQLNKHYTLKDLFK